MNAFTKSDLKEIESRINSRVCPYCGGSSKIELTYSENSTTDIVFHKVISSCCDDFKKIAQEIVKQEHNNQLQKKINTILNM